MANNSMRRKRLGLKTLFGREPGGFFIPYRYAPGVVAPGKGAYPAIEALFDARADDFQALLKSMAGYDRELQDIGADVPPAPRWDQDWFPTLDAAIAYTLVRTRKPRRIVEIGSGHSTRFFARAAADGGLGTNITAIDPAPRAVLDGLAVNFIRATLQDAGRAPFEALAAGDMLSIDSSHILMPGTDVDLLFSTILPALPAGLLVHIHDIFLPDGYPPDWEWRGYNEQNAVAGFLPASTYKPLFASHYAATRLSTAVARSPIAALPGLPSARPASLWLEKLG